jgi:hypothetical protein
MAGIYIGKQTFRKETKFGSWFMTFDRTLWIFGVENHDLEIIKILNQIHLELIAEDEQSGKRVAWDRSNNLTASSNPALDMEIDLYSLLRVLYRHMPCDEPSKLLHQVYG